MRKKSPIAILALILGFLFASPSMASAAGFHHPEQWDKNTLLYQGESGTEIKNLQYILNVMSFYTETGLTDADGIFGPKTAQTVKKYQKANGLVPDGIVGPKTWKSFSQFIEKKNASTYSAGGYMGLRLQWKYNSTSDDANSISTVYGNGEAQSDKYPLYSR